MGANVDVDLDFIGPLDVNANATVTANANVNANATVNANVNITNIPVIRLSIDPIRIILDPLRAHLPVDFSVGVNLLGHDILCVRLCGEAMISTEPVRAQTYVPNPCETMMVLDVHK